MKKGFLAVVISVVMIVSASCVGNKHSKAFNDSKYIIDNVTESLKQAKSCDDLDQAAFDIISVFGVQDIKGITDEEAEELEKLAEKMGKMIELKREELGCVYEDFWDSDEDMPVSEPYYGEEE